MSLKYEPASVPHHISVKWLFWWRLDLVGDGDDAARIALLGRDAQLLIGRHLQFVPVSVGRWVAAVSGDLESEEQAAGSSHQMSAARELRRV